MGRRQLGGVVLVLVSSLLLGACQVNWDSVGFGTSQNSYNPFETVLNPTTVPGLQQQWAANLGPYVETSPVLATGVAVSGGTENLVFDGDSEGLFEAIDTSTGAVVWQRQFASLLGGPTNPGCEQSPFGINGGALIDQSTGLVYLVDGADEMYALNLATGTTAPGWPLQISTDDTYEHVWSGLNEVSGTIFVPVSGDCDNPPYEGRLVAVNASTQSITATFLTEGTSGLSGGGIWGWGGVGVDQSLTHMYVATGNTLGNDSNAGYGDQVVELSVPDLSVVDSNLPNVPQGDNDFGGTPVLFEPSGCSPELAVENKTGVLVIYNQGALSSGPIQSLQIGSNSGSFIGDPAWDPGQNTMYVSNSASSSAFSNGMVALKFGADCLASPAWQTQLGPADSVVSPPVVADGVGYYGDGTGNTIYALDDATGLVLWSQLLSGPVFAPPIVANGMLFVPGGGKLYAFSLPTS